MLSSLGRIPSTLLSGGPSVRLKARQANVIKCFSRIKYSCLGGTSPDTHAAGAVRFACVMVVSDRAEFGRDILHALFGTQCWSQNASILV